MPIKRSQPPSQIQLRGKRGKYMLDIFSQLPDDVLISIISLLTMKEATKTSVLSRRWVKLWTFYSGTLDFDGQDVLYGDEQRFVDWVNQVVKAHQGHSIDGFSISCYLRSKYSIDINAWISFAIKKFARNLKLNLSCIKYSLDCRSLSELNHYRLSTPAHSLILPSGNTVKHICSNNPHTELPNFSDARFLTSLTLQTVNVSEADIYHFLSSCPLLEQLCVHNSNSLLGLTLSGTSLKLKHLDISYCYYFEGLVIHDVSLTSFVYCGKPINLPFESIPLVSNLVILDGDSHTPQRKLKKISKFLPRIESFTVEISPMIIGGVIASIKKKSLFRNLKNLEIHLQSSILANLIPYAELLKGSPFLHRLAIKLTEWRFRYVIPRLVEGSFVGDTEWYHELGEVLKLTQYRGQMELTSDYRYMNETPGAVEGSFAGGTEWSHEFLKVIEITQFYGQVEVLDLAKRLLTVAVSLDKIIFHLFFSPHELKNMCFIQVGKKEAIGRAKKLESHLPPGAALVIS